MIQKLKLIPKFFREVVDELRKVSWSTRRELVDSTLLVVAMTVVLTLYIFAVDIGLAKGMELLLK